MALTQEIQDVERQIAALDDDDETGFNRLSVELRQLKSRVGKRMTSPGQPGGGAMHRSGSASGSGSAYCKLHGLSSEKLDDGGFKSFGEFLSVLGSNRYDDRISTLRAAASTSLGASGGVMVPERFLAESLHPPGEQELVLPKARQYPMNEGTLRVSTLDNLSNSGGEMFGGFTAQWVAEGNEFTEMTPETSGITLHRKKLGLFTVASNELVSDSQYEAQLVPALQSAIQEFRDYAFFQGDGAGKPQGILSSPATITVSKETGQAADTLLIANIDNMYARLHPRLVRGAAWYVNPTCIPQLLGLVRSIGTGGVPVPVLNESSGQFFMYGLPVYLTAKLPVLGDEGDILLADVSQYAVGMGRGIVIDRSEHAKFQNDQVCWRAVWRGDGQALWRSAFTPRNGNTLSFAVKLAARA